MRKGWQSRTPVPIKGEGPVFREQLPQKRATLDLRPKTSVKQTKPSTGSGNKQHSLSEQSESKGKQPSTIPGNIVRAIARTKRQLSSGSQLLGLYAILSRKPNKKTSLIGMAALFALTIPLSFFLLPGKARGAVTVSTSTASTATQYSQQRKTWYDGARYWVAINANSRIEFWYSTNGSSWTENTSARIAFNTADFSIEADSSNAFIAYREPVTTNDINLEISSANSYPGTSFVWGTATMLNDGNACSVGTACPSNPSIARDTNNRILVTYRTYVPTQSILFSRLSTSANDISSFGTQQTIDGASGNDSKLSTTSPLSGGNMYSVWADGSTIEGRKATAGAWDSNSTPIAAGTSGAANNMSMVSNTTANEAYMSYIDSSGKTVFQTYEDGNGAASSKIDDAHDPAALTGLGLDGHSVVRASNGDLYALVESNADSKCHMWKSTNAGSTWVEQDSAHAITSCSSPTAMAIDSSNTITIIYQDPIVSGMVGLTFSNGTFGSVLIGLGVGNLKSADIAVDSNGKMHVVASENDGVSSDRVDYWTNASGSWTAAVVQGSGSIGQFQGVSITLSGSNIPQISYIDVTATAVKAAIGNANQATSFTVQSLDATVNTTAGSRGTAIGVDVSGNTWVTYVDATGTNQINLIKHLSGDAWTTWQTAVTDTKTGKQPSLAIGGNTVYVLYQNSLDDIAVDTYLSAWGGENTLQTGTFQGTRVRWAMNADNKNAPLDYLYSDGTDVYYNQMGIWRDPVTLDSNSGNAYTSISINSTHNNDLYIAWERSNVIYYKKCVLPYLSANCDPVATTQYTGGTTVAWVSMSANAGPATLPIVWTEGSGSPWSIKFDSIVVNHAPLSAGTLFPSGGSHVLSTTPTLTFDGFDQDSDDLRYETQIDTVNTFDGHGGTTSYSETNQDATGGISLLGSTEYAQSFTGNGGVLTTAKFYLSNTSATGSVGAKLYAHSGSFGSGGLPTGSPLDTSANINVSTITSSLSLITFSFTGGVQLTAGTNYFISVYAVSGMTSNINVGVDNSSPTAPGNNALLNGSWSVGGSYDLCFYVTTPVGPLLDKVSGTDAGFSGSPDSTDPFTNLQQVTYTVQAGDALTRGATYYWRVRAIDPNGSNTWTGFASSSFVVNSAPPAPTLYQPPDTQAGASLTPEFRFASTDNDGDYVKYWVDICSTSNCSTVVSSFCQASAISGFPAGSCTPSQTGWSGQSQQSGTAYASAQQAIYTIQAALNPSTPYYWRAYAIDPGGTNAWGSASSIRSFTTQAVASSPTVHIGGGSVNIGGGTVNIKP